MQRLVLFLVYIISCPVFAINCDLVISNADTKVAIAPYALYMVEETPTLEHSQVHESFDRFDWANSDKLNFGYSKSIYWIYVCITNSEEFILNRFLEIDYPVLDYIQIYEYQNGVLTNELNLGDKHPFQERPVAHPNFIVPLDFKPHEKKQLLIRVRSSSSLQIPALLWQKESKLTEDVHSMIGRGIYYGGMLIIACYNLLIFFAIRDKNHLYYVGYVISMTILSAGIHGITFQYLWPNATRWNDLSIIASLGCIVIFAALFTRSFLNTAVRPLLYKSLFVIAFGGGICITISIFLPYQQGIMLTIAWSLLGIIFSFTAGIIRWRDGYELAKFYNLAWGCMLAGGFILAINKLGFVPRNLFTENAARFGSGLEVMLLSLALGHRMNIDRKLREKAQKESIEAQVKAVESLKQYQQLYDNSAQGLFVLDRTGRLQQANPSFCKLIQQNVTTGSSENPNICNYFSDVKKAISGDLTDEFKQGYRCKGIRSNNSECWAVITLSANKNYLGEIESFEGAALDITSSIEKEEAELRRQTAEASAHAKSTFLANMSHEIRTPMNGVLGMTELMQGTDLDPFQKKYLSTIQSSGIALLNIINDILDYSKIEENKLDIERIELNLLQLIDECVSVFSFSSNDKGISLYVDYDPAIPWEIKSDPLRIRQIVLNLLSNAVKFTEEGYILIKVDMEACSQVRIAIIDTGIGINQDQQQKLFKSFSQAESSTSRRYGGTGLGLAISKRLSELMGGSIGVNSQPGMGSEFWFTIKNYSKENAFCTTYAHKILGKFTLTFAIADTFYIETTARFIKSVVDHVEVVHDANELIDKIKSDGFPALHRLVLDEHIISLLPDEIIDQYPKAFNNSLLICARGHANQYKTMISLDRILEEPVSTGQLYNALYATLHKESDVVNNNTNHADLSSFMFIVAEDNSVNQMVIKGILKKLGAEVKLAVNGFAALDLYKNNLDSVTAILMDIEMPDCDGYESTRLIRECEKSLVGKKVPIIGLSAHAMTEFSEKAIAIGMDGFVSKPISIADLVGALRELGLKC